MFQAVFAWARPLMDVISAVFEGFGVLAHDALPPAPNGPPSTSRRPDSR